MLFICAIVIFALKIHVHMHVGLRNMCLEDDHSLVSLPFHEITEHITFQSFHGLLYLIVLFIVVGWGFILFGKFRLYWRHHHFRWRAGNLRVLKHLNCAAKRRLNGKSCWNGRCIYQPLTISKWYWIPHVTRLGYFVIGYLIICTDNRQCIVLFWPKYIILVHIKSVTNAGLICQ
jgi:hypothetical protein